jgi:REP element-mobilizing transposase RayT
MPPTPQYDGRNIEPAFQLRYGWTGWPSPGCQFPPELPDLLPQVASVWETDGLRLLEHCCMPTQVQLTFSTKPDVAPTFVTARAKSRLQHALRQAGRAVPFSRNLALRSIGEARRGQIEQYVRLQVAHAPWADTDLGRRMEQFTVVNPHVDLSLPTDTERGRYWYNLHLVVVSEERYQIVDERRLAKVRDRALRIAEHKGYLVSCLSVMPDHVHIALRGDVAHSPQQIALAMQNNLAYALGQVRLWQPTYYVGTFSEYDMGAVRRGAR